MLFCANFFYGMHHLTFNFSTNIFAFNLDDFLEQFILFWNNLPYNFLDKSTQGREENNYNPWKFLNFIFTFWIEIRIKKKLSQGINMSATYWIYFWKFSLQNLDFAYLFHCFYLKILLYTIMYNRKKFYSIQMQINTFTAYKKGILHTYSKCTEIEWCRA